MISNCSDIQCECEDIDSGSNVLMGKSEKNIYLKRMDQKISTNLLVKIIKFII
jgi:hypothetical protein